jgi:hypothetical protein
MPIEDLTEKLIKLRNLVNALNHLPIRGSQVSLATRDTTYIGHIEKLSISERTVTLIVEDGIKVIVPFGAVVMPEKSSKSRNSGA